MYEADEVIAEICSAFADVEPPPSWCLVSSNEGSEPASLASEFASVPKWESLDPEILDAAPSGLASALSFFSDEAFRYYLPAYLIASVRNQLGRVDPVFHLIHGFQTRTVVTPVNPRRYGARTWRDQAVYRYAMFTRSQASAIASYLNHHLHYGNRSPFELEEIEEALNNYWRERDTP